MTTTYKQIEQAKLDYSSLASTTVRQLAFAGIAVIWLFRNEVDTEQPFTKLLLVSLISFTTAIAFDVLQYVWSAWLWTVRFWSVDGPGRSETDAFPDLNRWLLAVGYVFFGLKQVAVILGAVLLLLDLAQRWRLLD